MPGCTSCNNANRFNNSTNNRTYISTNRPVGKPASQPTTRSTTRPTYIIPVPPNRSNNAKSNPWNSNANRPVPSNAFSGAPVYPNYRPKGCTSCAGNSANTRIIPPPPRYF